MFQMLSRTQDTCALLHFTFVLVLMSSSLGPQVVLCHANYSWHKSMLSITKQFVFHNNHTSVFVIKITNKKEFLNVIYLGI